MMNTMKMTMKEVELPTSPWYHKQPTTYAQGFRYFKPQDQQFMPYPPRFEEFEETPKRVKIDVDSYD